MFPGIALLAAGALAAPSSRGESRQTRRARERRNAKRFDRPT